MTLKWKTVLQAAATFLPFAPVEFVHATQVAANLKYPLKACGELQEKRREVEQNAEERNGIYESVQLTLLATQFFNSSEKLLKDVEAIIGLFGELSQEQQSGLNFELSSEIRKNCSFEIWLELLKQGFEQLESPYAESLRQTLERISSQQLAYAYSHAELSQKKKWKSFVPFFIEEFNKFKSQNLQDSSRGDLENELTNALARRIEGTFSEWANQNPHELVCRIPVRFYEAETNSSLPEVREGKGSSRHLSELTIVFYLPMTFDWINWNTSFEYKRVF